MAECSNYPAQGSAAALMEPGQAIAEAGSNETANRCFMVWITGGGRGVEWAKIDGYVPQEGVVLDTLDFWKSSIGFAGSTFLISFPRVSPLCSEERETSPVGPVLVPVLISLVRDCADVEWSGSCGRLPSNCAPAAVARCVMAAAAAGGGED
jgi:hypothetical protein